MLLSVGIAIALPKDLSRQSLLNIVEKIFLILLM